MTRISGRGARSQNPAHSTPTSSFFHSGGLALTCSVPDDSEGEEEMDMDLDDSDSDADVPSVPAPSAAKRNPYPLEGSYIDEDDRDR